jgi:hypothetical protein
MTSDEWSRRCRWTLLPTPGCCRITCCATRCGAPRRFPAGARRTSSTSSRAASYLSINLLQLSLGFLLQDRAGLTGEQTAGVTGLALLLGGVPMLVVQAVVIPKLNWSPVRLLRVGIPSPRLRSSS